MSPTSLRLLIASLLVCLLAGGAILFLLKDGKHDKSKSTDGFNATSIPMSDSLADELTEGSAQEPTSAEVAVSTTFASEPSSAETTTTDAPTTAFVPFDEDEKADLPQCTAVQASKPQCLDESPIPRSELDKWTKAEYKKVLPDLLDLVKPIHYDVNISVSHAEVRQLAVSVELFVKMPRGGALIPLHLHRTVNGFHRQRVFVRDCGSGQFVCVSSVVHLSDERLLLIGLNRSVSADSVLGIYFEKLDVQLHSNLGLVLQAPSLWEKQRAWILASLFDDVGARSVFPVVDHANAKASWRLCAEHGRNLTSRSNMPSQVTIEVSPTHVQHCFKKSPALRPDQFAFVVFENLLSIHNDNANPRLEVFVAKHLPANEAKWIVLEVQQALARMTELTGVAYPLEKLTVLSTPISTDGTHDLGLIQVRDTWIEYPKYELTHTILLSQVVQQWISNVFTICDTCVQDGLATYVTWIVGAEYESIGQSVLKRVLNARERLLHDDGDRAPMQALQIVPTKPEKRCVTQNALMFASVAEVFGIDAMQRFLSTVATAKQWGGCLTREEMGNTLFGATNSLVSKRLFDSFSNAESHPTLKFKMAGNKLSVELENVPVNEVTVPFGIFDNTGRHLTLVHNGSTIEEVLSGNTVLANPNTTTLFRSFYDVDNYDRLADCVLDPKCAAFSKEVASQAFEDLCWAHLNNKMGAPGHAGPWQQLFHKLAAGDLVHGDCQCCMMGKGRSSAKCKWTWKRRCAALALKVDKF